MFGDGVEIEGEFVAGIAVRQVDAEVALVVGIVDAGQKLALGGAPVGDACRVNVGVGDGIHAEDVDATDGFVGRGRACDANRRIVFVRLGRDEVGR